MLRVNDFPSSRGRHTPFVSIPSTPIETSYQVTLVQMRLLRNSRRLFGVSPRSPLHHISWEDTAGVDRNT